MGAPGTAAAMTDDGTIQLAEESLSVGKRAVSGGTTRIRKYVVETPVEEQVNLHTEKVRIERRPVTVGRPVGDVSFADKPIEMTEMSEEAVVSKIARITEKIGLRKEASDRVETIKDTVRREEAQVEKLPRWEVGTHPHFGRFFRNASSPRRPRLIRPASIRSGHLTGTQTLGQKRGYQHLRPPDVRPVPVRINDCGYDRGNERRCSYP